MAHAKPRILFLDIETKPAIVATFGIREQHIGHRQILKDGGRLILDRVDALLKARPEVIDE